MSPFRTDARDGRTYGRTAESAIRSDGRRKIPGYNARCARRSMEILKEKRLSLYKKSNFAPLGRALRVSPHCS